MAVQTKAELFAQLRACQPRLRELGVKRYGVFGSFVRDEANAESDVDLLVEFHAGQETFDNFMELGFFWKICSDDAWRLSRPNG